MRIFLPIISLSCLILASIVASPASAAGNPDINGDGHIVPLDLLFIINHLNKNPGKYDQKLDVNADGKVNKDDAEIVKYLINQGVKKAEDGIAYVITLIVTEAVLDVFVPTPDDAAPDANPMGEANADPDP